MTRKRRHPPAPPTASIAPRRPRLGRLTSVLLGLGLAALVPAALVPGAAAAQDEGPPGFEHGPPDAARIREHMEQRFEQLKARIRIDATQERRIRQAMSQALERIERMRAQHPERGPERMEARREILWELEDRIHAALTCDQREQLRRLRREMRAEHGGRHGRHGRHGRGPGQGRRGPPSRGPQAGDGGV